jgi:hypothetical protein
MTERRSPASPQVEGQNVPRPALLQHGVLLVRISIAWMLVEAAVSGAAAW